MACCLLIGFRASQSNIPEFEIVERHQLPAGTCALSPFDK
jgi:hypothetical protein